MKSIKRRRLSEQAWSEIMRRFEGAGITVRQFCAHEGVSTQSFTRWRERLAGERELRTAMAQASELARQSRSEASRFIELGELPGAAAATQTGAGVELRLELGGGVVLQIVRR
jgi:hypothetical protein